MKDEVNRQLLDTGYHARHHQEQMMNNSEYATAYLEAMEEIRKGRINSSTIIEANEETDVLIITFRAGTVSYEAYSPIPESLLFRLQELNKLWNEDPEALVRIAQNAHPEPFEEL